MRVFVWQGEEAFACRPGLHVIEIVIEEECFQEIFTTARRGAESQLSIYSSIYTACRFLVVPFDSGKYHKDLGCFTARRLLITRNEMVTKMRYVTPMARAAQK